MKTKREFTRQILLFEAIGFGLVIAVLWANETIDLPRYLLNAPGTPRWQEAALESVLVLLLAGSTLYWNYRALARIRFLEGFLRICSFCKKVNIDEQWIPVESYVAKHSAAVFSHGLCPTCLREHYPEVRAE